MLDGGKWSKENEKLILEARDSLLIRFMEAGYSVIIDDTNLEIKHEEQLRKIVETYAEYPHRSADYEFVVKDFTDVPLRECITRNETRRNKVPKGVILSMYNRYLKPKGEDDVTEIDPEYLEQNKDLPDAVIFDLDGTLALFGDASPYDRDFSYDTVNYPVFDALRLYQDNGYKIIICSGRKGESVDVTSKWLEKNGIAPDLFIMRKAGDVRKDWIIKEEMFRKYILPNYNVNVVYDDRDRVVDMWRGLGVPVFQVAPGNF